MLSAQEIAESGEPVEGEGTPYYEDGSVLRYSGGLYPFRDGKLINPLDPVNLLLCWPVLNGYDENEGFERILSTMLAVTEFRKKKFTIVTRYKSGAARAIKLEDGTDNIIILGDYAKQNSLCLPILSTQLSDKYDQTDVKLWKDLGFHTPPHYGICTNTSVYGVDGWHGLSLMEGTDTVTYYNIVGDGKKITIKKRRREAEAQEVSHDDDRDWDFESIDDTEYDIHVEIDSKYKADYRMKASVDGHPTTPNFVWEEKQ